MEKECQIRNNNKKKLEVYGKLNTLLDTDTERIKRQNLGQEKKEIHFIEIPLDLDKLQQIFEGSRYLLSDKLLQTYLDFVKEYKYFNDLTSRKKGPNLLFYDLSKMHEITKEEFKEVKNQYEDLMK